MTRFGSPRTPITVPLRGPCAGSWTLPLIWEEAENQPCSCGLLLAPLFQVDRVSGSWVTPGAPRGACCGSRLCMSTSLPQELVAPVWFSPLHGPLTALPRLPSLRQSPTPVLRGHLLPPRELPPPIQSPPVPAPVSCYLACLDLLSLSVGKPSCSYSLTVLFNFLSLFFLN